MGGLWYCFAGYAPIGGPISTTFTAPCSYDLQTVTADFIQRNFPDAVTATLMATKSGAADVQLSWGATADTTGYRIYRSQNPVNVFADPTTVIKTAAASPFVDVGVQSDGLDWYYKVTSVNDCIEAFDFLQARFNSNAPVCDGSYSVSFTDQTTGGVPPYSYVWDFGDGSPNSTATNPVHLYPATIKTWNVTLTVTDSDTPTPSVSQTTDSVGTGAPVTAGFTYVKNGLSVSFSGSGSGGSGSLAYSWIFGDGSTGSSQQSPGHVYSAPGTYDVTLVVSDLLSRWPSVVVPPVTVP